MSCIRRGFATEVKPFPHPFLYYFLSYRRTRVYSVTKTLPLDISAHNIAYGVHKDTFTPEALEQTFSDEDRSYTIFLGPEDPPPPRPPHLPEYITRIESLALLTDVENMSKIQILDFGEGILALH